MNNNLEKNLENRADANINNDYNTDKNNNLNLKHKSKQWVKEAGEILQYALDDSNFNRKNWDIEIRKERKELRKINYERLVSKSHNKYISKLLSGIAVQPINENNKKNLEYIVGYVAGGLPEWILDIAIDSFNLEKDKVVEASLVTEYFIKAPTATIESYFTVKASNTILQYIGIDTKEISPMIFAATYCTTRLIFNKYRQKMWETKKKYVPNPLPLINISSWTFTGPLYITSAVIKTRKFIENNYSIAKNKAKEMPLVKRIIEDKKSINEYFKEHGYN